MRGTEEQFQDIMRKLAENIKSYENRSQAHMRFVEMNDDIFSSYGWTKSEYYAELSSRLGIMTNDTRKKKTAAKSVNASKNNTLKKLAIK